MDGLKTGPRALLRTPKGVQWSGPGTREAKAKQEGEMTGTGRRICVVHCFASVSPARIECKQWITHRFRMVAGASYGMFFRVLSVHGAECRYSANCCGPRVLLIVESAWHGVCEAQA